MITRARLVDVLSYDPDTGIFRWRVQLAARGPVGSIAGHVNIAGYRMIRIDGELVMAHRLVLLWATGEMPVLWVDHINGHRDDNRRANLREATKRQNGANMASHRGSTSHYKGVSWSKERKKWQVNISKHGKVVSLGRFDDERDAAETYIFAALELHGEFARTT